MHQDSKTMEKCSKNAFSCAYNAAESHFTWFGNAATRADDNIILMSQNYVCYCAR